MDKVGCKTLWQCGILSQIKTIETLHFSGILFFKKIIHYFHLKDIYFQMIQVFLVQPYTRICGRIFPISWTI